MDAPILIVPKIAWWGKQSGGFYDHKKPKNHSTPWGLVVQMKKWAAGSNNSGPKGQKARWYQGRFGQRSKLKLHARD